MINQFEFDKSFIEFVKKNIINASVIAVFYAYSYSYVILILRGLGL